MVLSSSPDRLLGAATYAFLFDRSLPDAIDAVAESGARHLELMAAPPHVVDGRIPSGEAVAIRRQLAGSGITATSLNPTFLDLNLASVNSGMRAETVRQVRNALRTCHELEIPLLVLFPGRRHVLAPAPLQTSREILLAELAALLPLAAELGVVIGLENGPSNFLDRAWQVADVCTEIGSPILRAVFDVANAHMVEDPVDGLAAIVPHLALVHVSDTTRQRWAHGPVGTGDVDFPRFAAALDRSGYDGVTIMEIIDPEHPIDGLVRSSRALAGLGWTLG